VAEITPEAWDGWLARLEVREGSIAMPRFKLEYKQKLNDVVSRWG